MSSILSTAAVAGLFVFSTLTLPMDCNDEAKCKAGQFYNGIHSSGTCDDATLTVSFNLDSGDCDDAIIGGVAGCTQDTPCKITPTVTWAGIPEGTQVNICRAVMTIPPGPRTCVDPKPEADGTGAGNYVYPSAIEIGCGTPDINFRASISFDECELIAFELLTCSSCMTQVQ